MNPKPLSSIILCLCLFGASCTPEKRLARLVKNHPELAKVDTVWAEVKYIVPEVRAETSFVWSTDTVILEKDRLSVRILTDTITKRITVWGQCKSDTLIKVVPKYISTVSPVKEVRKGGFWGQLKSFGFGFLIAVAAIGIYLYSRKV